MRIERSAVLGRDIRREDGPSIAESTWDGVRASLREGRVDQALAGIDYGCAEAKMMYDSMCGFADHALGRLAEVAGDDEAARLLPARPGTAADAPASGADAGRSPPVGTGFQRGSHARTMGRNDADRLAAGWDEVRADVRDGWIERALTRIDTCCALAKTMHDDMCRLADDALTRLAQLAGDEEVHQLLRKRYRPVIERWLETTPGTRESVERGIEFQRGHFGATSVREEADRFVVTCDPCGSGGQLRRTGRVARVEGAHDWTWNRENVPYYCTHCAVMWEILPTEMRGYPIRINLPPANDADPCVHLYYKSPDSIPEEYFARISRARGVAPMAGAAAPPGADAGAPAAASGDEGAKARS